MKLRSLLGLFFALFLSLTHAAARSEEWAKVDDAVQKSLPQTAITALDAIIASAQADGRHAEATYAIARKIALQGEIEGGKAEEMIVRLEAEIAKAPSAMKPMMEAILGHWYWNYFQQNRWRFLQRTQTAEAPGKDIQTWDLAHILAEIDRHFTAALADEAALKKVPIADFDELLEKGSVPDNYRPTLYDFLAHEALSFYSAGEQGAVKAEDTFVIDATSPIFGTPAEFLAWKPGTTDTDSPTLKAIALFQNLLRFHDADKDRSAYLDVDLVRLAFGNAHAQGPEKDERYEAALRRLIEKANGHEITARAAAVLATKLHELGRSAEAHQLASKGLKDFPKSPGGAMCFNLIGQIEAKSSQINTEFVWNAPWPSVDVTYRNLTQVYFRAVPLDFEKELTRSRWNFGSFSNEQTKALLNQTPAHAWSAKLPATTDFKERTESVPTPGQLKPGFYAILSSHNAAFSEDNNVLSVAIVWVSRLALVLQTESGKPQIGGFVLDAESGQPVADATVRAWSVDRNGQYSPRGSTRSDQDGRFSLNAPDRQTILLAESGGSAVSNQQPIYTSRYERDRDRTTTSTYFFTDRALYRPGQTINYKGISVRANQGSNQYETLARTRVEVLFRDPNGKEIAKATHTTNDFGSFSGVFTAPRDRLMGQMSIQVISGPPGGSSVSVEEYKRPKFEVEIAKPAEAAKLNTTVSLTGKATAYTGATIGSAKVKWRVERVVRLPLWCWWWQPPSVQAIAHGTTTTGDDGQFKIEFPAAPDRTVPEKLEPVFSYRVHADVTDTTGETRSADQHLAAGYTALEASLGAAEWQTPEKPVELTITTQSLDAVPQSARGVLTVHTLQQPAKVARAPLQQRSYWWQRTVEPPVDPTKPDSWALGEEVAKKDFSTDDSGSTKIALSLKAGIYRATVETKDRFGKRVTARETIEVIDPTGKNYTVKVPRVLTASNWSIEPGKTFAAQWGTGYPTGRAYVELERDGRKIKSYWTPADRTQNQIELPIDEAMRGGVTLRVTYVRENRAYLDTRTIDVPWSNKQLAVKWESFRSKLLPGAKETWTATVTGSNATKTATEMVAALYDASLDQYRAHAWPSSFGAFRQEYSGVQTQFPNTLVNLNTFHWGWNVQARSVDWDYRRFGSQLVISGSEPIILEAFSVAAAGDVRKRKAAFFGAARAAPPAPAAMMRGQVVAESRAVAADALEAELDDKAVSIPVGKADPSQPDLAQVTARKNLNETAFFFPQLIADESGLVKLQFTMPEALTRWKFLGFAHDKELRAGLLTDQVVTAKDLMVEPNPPRFVREGDAVEFTVKVSNQSDAPQSGKVRLTFADAATLTDVTKTLGLKEAEQSFDVPAKQSRTFSWRVAIPDGMGFLTYKAVGASAKASDGEEGFLPVLSRHILVTESLPLPIRGKGTRDFSFDKLLASGNSSTLQNQSLTVQMVSQPAWYAVLALPYLIEFPHECSEQLFNRFYANALARQVAGSDPKIRRIFDLWKNTPALDSPLMKNQDLKSVMIEETPWLRDANRESESRRNVGLLFDGNRLDSETERTLQQLAERQLSDGLWAWFPGGRSNEYISLYIVTGFGRLRHLGVKLDAAPAVKALARLDAWMDERYREIKKSAHPEEYIPGATEALYLYGRSFFLDDQPIERSRQAAINFFLQQARGYWTQAGSRQTQAHFALALQRFGDKATPAAIVKSLKERSVTSEELGRFWRDTENSWWWYHAPIETQAMMIEAFREITHDDQAVEDCQVWLLKQKQTQDWKTTKATADAVYALLLGGKNLLASDALVEVSLGGQTIKPEKVEAGTGFYEQKFGRGEIKPEQGRITVKKTDDGVSWGSVHWQYLEDMTKVTPHTGTPLTLTKKLFVKENTAKGPVLKAVNGPVSVGDELVVRLELRTDRDMEFVHLKDQRGSGTEPVNVLSQYKYQDGLGYYESTRDTASHFFIEYLRKGTYVFEYSTRVQLKGSYQSGIAEIQCMYAPEFNSHSESITIEAK